jgi:hypothetical protein
VEFSKLVLPGFTWFWLQSAGFLWGEYRGIGRRPAKFLRLVPVGSTWKMGIFDAFVVIRHVTAIGWGGWEFVQVG